MSLPTDFKDLTKDELIRSAVEDFAIALEDDEAKTKRTVLAAFAENSIFWDDYVAQHPEVLPEPVVVEPEPVLITSNAPSHGVIGEDTVTGYITGGTVEEVPEQVNIHVAQPAIVPQTPADQFLLKMVRENPLFEVRGYRFTEEHPYALVKANDAMYILEHEDGFRQAYPQELAEFYG